jgi:hypothetical protein
MVCHRCVCGIGSTSLNPGPFVAFLIAFKHQLDHPFTPPTVSPSMKYFWARK